MAALLDGILKVFDFNDSEGTEFETDDYGLEEEKEEEISSVGREKKMGVVRPINTRGYEVIVAEPKSFEESSGIAKNLIDRKTVVLNLDLIDKGQSQRVVDFLAGASHALKGHQQKIGEGVFIFTPNNVNITAEQARSASVSFTDAIWDTQVK